MPLDLKRPFVALQIAVLTVSDSRDPTTDRSGDLLAARITDSGHNMAARSLVTDNVPAITACLRVWIEDPLIQVVVSTGGTGLTGRDVTVEAHRALYHKEIEAFAPMFTAISHSHVGTSALQSRACAGVAGGTYLFALPGSPGACRDAWDDILRWQLDNRHRPCNLVEILPRLQEH